MKRKFMYSVVVVSALLLLACSGAAGKFFGVGSLPSSSTEPDAVDATFRFVLVAEDKEPDEDNFADTFRGQIAYTDEAVGVDIVGMVADALDDGITSEQYDGEMGGVYYDDSETDLGTYGTFAGFWTGVVPGETPSEIVTEGIFVLRAKDNTDEDPNDRVWMQLFDLNANVFEDVPLYDNLPVETQIPRIINSGNIRYIPTKVKDKQK